MVTVYTTPKCMGCMLTKKWLTDRGIPFESVDLTDPANINDYQAIRALGHTSAPVVAVGQGYEVVWSGFRPDLLEEHCTSALCSASLFSNSTSGRIRSLNSDRPNLHSLPN